MLSFSLTSHCHCFKFILQVSLYKGLEKQKILEMDNTDGGMILDILNQNFG